MYGGCYSIHFYCDGTRAYYSCSAKPLEVSGTNEADCKRQARKSGWKLEKDGRCLCPNCRQDKIPLRTLTSAREWPAGLTEDDPGAAEP